MGSKIKDKFFMCILITDTSTNLMDNNCFAKALYIYFTWSFLMSALD